jgi:hypothetical protein
MVFDATGYPWHHLCLATVASASILHQAEAYLSSGNGTDHTECDDTTQGGVADMADSVLGSIDL